MLFVGTWMFAPVYADSRVKQPVTFLISLSLQCVILALLCILSLHQAHQARLCPANLHQALMTPLDLAQQISPPLKTIIPAPPLKDEKISLQSGPAKLEAPGAAKPAAKAAARPQAKREATPSLTPEAKPEPTPDAQPDTTVAAADNSSGGGDDQAIAPFPDWQTNMAGGHAFMHHEIKNALPVFTPEPPILHGDVPEEARGKDVVLNVVINDQGSIVQVQVVQGIGYGVERAIVDTLRQWVYVPAKFNGMAIASQQQLHFHFPG
jgi:TonB family protein